MKRVLTLAICLSFLIDFEVASAQERGQHSIDAAHGSNQLDGNSVYQLNSVWIDQDGKSINLTHFRGKPLVLAMIYTSCKDACPMIVSDMQTIEKTLPEQVREQVRFALVSFDPVQDSPAQMKRFASARGLNPKHWTMLIGSDDSVRLLAAALGIRYRKASNGEFSHSSVITVLDSKGDIQHQQTGLRKDPGEVVEVISGLLNRTK